MTSKEIDLKLIQFNEGQVKGLPKNPRRISDDKLEKLKKSLTEDPEMTKLRELLVLPVGDKYIVIGGNMRLKAMRALGWKKAPCKILDAETPVEKLAAYTIKDNAPYGAWDWDMLANDWDVDLLSDWGVDTTFIMEDVDIEGLFDKSDSRKENETITIKVILPEDIKDKEEDIRRNIELTLADYKGIKIK